MTIKKFHELVFFFLDKDRVGFFSHEEVDLNAHFAQVDYFNELRPKPGWKGATYGQNTYVNEALNPFKVVKEFSNADSPDGLIDLSGENTNLPQSAQFFSMWVQGFNNDTQETEYHGVPCLNDDELPKRLNSKLLRVSERYPVCAWASNQHLQLYPKVPMAGKISYLKAPCPPQFKYTMNDREVVYSEAGSTHLEWNDSYINQIVVRTCQYMGVNVSAGDVVQAMMQKQTENA